jgi:hypothetical protein
MNVNLITSGGNAAVSTVLGSIIRACWHITRGGLSMSIGWRTKLRVLQCEVFVYSCCDKYCPRAT